MNERTEISLFTPTRSVEPPAAPHSASPPTDRILFFRCRTFRRHSYFHSRHYTRVRVCAVHVDRFGVGEHDSANPASSLVHSPRSLIKGGVTRVFQPLLDEAPHRESAIGRGDFYKRVSPRGLVYLFRRRRRGRGGRPGGIRAISKGGRNTAIFIRAAGMQSRSGAGWRGWGRWRPF